MENTQTATKQHIATGRANGINWFEIPVTDMERAKAFYMNIFELDDMVLMDMPGMQMASFPGEQDSGKVSGALAKSDFHTPGADGVTIYLNGNPDLSLSLDRVESAGGKVVMPKTLIMPDVGYMAFFMDTEGNRVALHSNA